MTRTSQLDADRADRPPPALASARGDLPLRAVTVRATVVGHTADVEVEQTFENTFDEVLEVSYVFPLPDLAAVTRCELRVGERVVTAKLEERGAARELYADAIEAGKRAALAEQERPGVFTVTLGNLAPNERATVRFEMAYLLPREDGRHVLRFPLVVGERYVPGGALAGDDVGNGVARDTTEVPDASRVSPPRLASGAARPALSIEVTLLHGGLGIHDVESSLHLVRESREAARTVVRLAPDQRLDRDFVLRFRIGDDAIRSQLAACPDGDEGTFQLTLVPPLARIRTRPHDLVLLLDRSGSMEGWKIVAARRALARMIDVLDDSDRFAVYAFESTTVACADLPIDQLHPATAANRARVIEMLGGMTAAGGTEMLQPLELATSLLAAGEKDERDRWIVLVTDGQVANEDALVTLVERGNAKVLALGIDDAVNSSLLRRLASATGGRVELVQQEAELEDALDRLHLLIAVPVIERVTLDADAIVPGSLVPAGPLNVFPGVPLVVRGRYRVPLDAVRVRGRIGREPFEQTVRAERADVPALRACWAREHVLALEDRFAASRGTERGTLCNDIIATSLRFGVLSRFTAFVAIDEHGATHAVAARHVQQPVEPTLPAVASRSQVATTRWGGVPATATQTQTRSGTLKGKYAYLSPEVARGLEITPAHEVFCLAHLLWELLTLRRLFHAQNDLDTLHLIVEGTLPSPLLPPELAHLDAPLRRAFEREPTRRYATAGDFADALAAVAPAIASRTDVAAWLARIAPRDLAEQATWLARAAAVRPPRDGYLAIAQLAQTSDGTIYVAARDGHAPVAYARLYPAWTQDSRLVENFLSQTAISLEGFDQLVDAGVDLLSGVFRASTFIHGVDLQRILRLLADARTTIPAPIALSIIIDAARALHAALDLPTPDATRAGLILREMHPSSLRISITGQPIWTALGIAPSPHFTVPRRSRVSLAVASNVSLDPQSSPPPHESRFVVVPRKRTPSPPRRRWLRWWRE